jgi:PAS domain S-box-containing protein
MWSGAQVDASMLDALRGAIIKRIMLIASGIFAIVIVVVWRFSSMADRFRQQLVDALRGLIENNTPINLGWRRPAEIRELGEEINKLSNRYLEIMAERQKAESRLADLNRRLNMILENAAEGILELDAQGNILFANPAACTILGFDRSDLLGNDLHSLVHYLREDRSQYPEEECPFCNAVKSGNYKLFREDVFWRKNGESVSVEYLTAPILDSSKNMTGMVMCLRDVTERKKAEKKAADLQKQLLHSQKMEAVGTLAGGVAHDFNNLLTAITGYSELLAMDLEDNEEALRQVNFIATAARRASELTRQLLAFSRKQEAEKRIVELNELIRHQEKMLRRLIGEAIELVTQLSDEQPLNAMADPGMIEQVVMNIVVNARDAMPEGGRILIRTEKRHISPGDEYMYEGGRAGDFVCIAVEDTGSGIDPDTMKQIFNPFFTTKPVDKGTGLGLSVAYGIMEQHGGWINVYSEPGRGTVFKIFLPEYTGQSQKDFDEGARQKQLNISGNGRKILLLEDDIMVREIAREILESRGFNVTTAESMSEARQTFTESQGDFDLVMSDVILPDGNGLHFIEWVLEQAPEMPVLLASGYIDESSHVDEIRKRGLPFVQKPFHVFDLVIAVDAAMKKN